MAQQSTGGVSRGRHPDLGAMDIIAMMGFSLYFGWMLICAFWFYASLIPDMPIATRDLVQSFVFIGTVCGYFLMHLMARRKGFNPFTLALVVAQSVVMLLLPVSAAFLHLGFILPLPALCIINFCTGIVIASGTILWLDVCSRMTERGQARFTAFSLFAGSALLALVMLLTFELQVVFALLYAIGSMVLLRYVSPRARFNGIAPFHSSTELDWRFAREVEPLFVAFGIVFGATFVYLFNFGGPTLIVGLLFIVPGAGLIALLASFGKEPSITVVQRSCLCITVFSCVALPFTSGLLQLCIAGLVVMCWAVILAINYSLAVRKLKQDWVSPVFRRLPVRLSFRSIGFCVGWLYATAICIVFGAHAEAFAVARLVSVVVLVAVFVIFLPDAHHHDEGAMEKLASESQQQVKTVERTESELFEARCAAVSSLYGLSPREADVLRYLARGRNAAYLQEKLCVSPHTVKSHIYNIYRKLDIHSQQKLMNFIEEYPLSEQELSQFEAADR